MVSCDTGIPAGLPLPLGTFCNCKSGLGCVATPCGTKSPLDTLLSDDNGNGFSDVNLGLFNS